MALGFSLGFGIWYATISYLLIKPMFWAMDVLSVGALTVIVAAALFAYNRANRWAMIRTLPPDLRPAPPKGPTWVEQIQESRRLSWAMVSYGLAAYTITVAGLVLVLLVTRSYRPKPPYIVPTVLYAAFGAWSLMIWSLGNRLLRELTRRWGLVREFVVGDPRMGDRLWDRELDHEYAAESRPIS